MSPLRHRLDRRTAAGFTFMELTVSMAIVGIITVGIGSVMLIATRAMPARGSDNERLIDAASALEQMTCELQYAQACTERSAHAITVVIPDRTWDGWPDTVRYAWSGNPGAPLTRQFNGGRAAEFLPDVHDVQIDCILRPVTVHGSGTEESTERLLLSHDTSGGVLEGLPVTASDQVGQYVRPALDPGAVGWRVTRVKFMAKMDALGPGAVLARLQAASGRGVPSGKVLAQTPLKGFALAGGYFWQEAGFAMTGTLSPDQGACLVLQLAAGEPVQVLAERGGTDTPDAHLVLSADQGVNWTADTARDMLLYVYGTVTSSDPDSTETTYHLTGIDLRLQSGPNAAARVRTGVKVLAEPEVPGP